MYVTSHRFLNNNPYIIVKYTIVDHGFPPNIWCLLQNGINHTGKQME